MKRNAQQDSGESERGTTSARNEKPIQANNITRQRRECSSEEDHGCTAVLRVRFATEAYIYRTALYTRTTIIQYR